MELTRRALVKGIAGAAAVGTPVSMEATKTGEDLDLEVTEMAGEYKAKGNMNLLYKGENQLDADSGSYDIGMDDNLFDANVAGAYARVDVDMDGSWEMQVGINYDEKNCTQRDRETYKETVEAFGAEIDNGTIEVDNNKTSDQHAEGIGDMLEEGATGNSSSC